MHNGSDPEFPPFRFDLLDQRLWRNAELVSLRPKPFAVLGLSGRPRGTAGATRRVSQSDMARHLCCRRSTPRLHSRPAYGVGRCSRFATIHRDRGTSRVSLYPGVNRYPATARRSSTVHSGCWNFALVHRCWQVRRHLLDHHQFHEPTACIVAAREPPSRLLKNTQSQMVYNVW